MMQYKLLFFLLILTVSSGCSSYKAKYADGAIKDDTSSKKEVSHTFYLIGDAGKSPYGGMKDALKLFKKKLDSANANSTAIFLGDNIYPAGMPDPIDSTKAYLRAKSDIDAQIKTLENFGGNPFFIPGNHDWYTEGLIGLKREQDYIQGALGRDDVFFPQDGCPLKTIEVNDDIAIIVLDTEWYLVNWNKHPTINDGCTIKSRSQFWLQLEAAIRQNSHRTTLIAMHHPMFTYGQHGGQFTFRQNLYPKGNIGPIPLVGSIIDVLRKTTGTSIEDQQNKRYTELKDRLITLAQYSENVILASGHEHTLQYIVEKNTPQIVSGSGSKMDGARLLNGSRFATGRRGYAILEVYTDGSSRVNFFAVNDDNVEKEDFMFTAEVLPPDRGNYEDVCFADFHPTTKTQIYTEKKVDRGGFFRFLWGDRYRKLYATEVTAPTVRLDTLFGGVEPLQKMGGHQSRSLRLQAENGNEYLMRALKKDAELYLKTMALQNKYVVGDFGNTLSEGLLMDFYSGSHPYAPLAVGPLSDAIGLYHTNPKLYYVPKQPALKNFDQGFGDALYFIEAYAGNGTNELKEFGYANEIKSSNEVLENIREDEKYEVDTQLYLRARLFDMVVGDWNRRTDQWLWAAFKDDETDKTIYRPIPTDRDMVFSKHSDGLLMRFATRILPTLGLMEGFGDEIENVKGFNSSPRSYFLDMALLAETTLADWKEQARFIRDHITDAVIERAMSEFPEAVQKKSAPEIKSNFLARLADLERTAAAYYKVLNKYAVVTGTDNEDSFEIDILNKNEIEIKVYRNENGVKDRLFFRKRFNSAVTREIWVYGLDGKDRFEVSGEHRSAIKLRLTGGAGNDSYDLKEGGNVAVYDYRSKKNIFNNTGGAKIRMTDDYDTNTYLPMQLRNSTNRIEPIIGYNSDEGLKISLGDTYIYEGFRKNPFTQKHKLDAAFYFATSGFKLGYSGEYAHVFENWNLETAAHFTSPNYTINFFGYGTESENLEDDLGLDYNRARLRSLRLAPSLVYRWPLGASFKTGVSFETIEVEETQGRFINRSNVPNGRTESSNFLGIDAQYAYANADNETFPTLGMATSLKLGYKTNLENRNNFGYVVPSFSLYYKLIPNGRLVLAPTWKAHFNLGNGYEFYQAAGIGGDEGLRGFRNRRFVGKKAYFQNTDLRFSLRKLRTELLPVTLGVYGGFDYGRVWMPNESSNVWHTSYGGGVFLNGADILSARMALFNSEEGFRFSFGLGFGF
ncbi:metallophosphoesterase [Pricia sp. S334]|uniref:Metallophosphoesterase n=1 Tax=Pricia mediterranea TaxID=3076079 RepID=A0ABU3L629_9FLAO|nr:metallophosphoesterase [Pricia sp. S334]MDT7829196.1 metallophosphoesterase [Pricia sp. S334]